MPDDHGTDRHQLALRAAGHALWEWDLTSDLVRLSPEWSGLRGADEEPEEIAAQSWFELIHPRDLIRLRAMIDAHLLAEGAPIRCTHRLRQADGSWRWVRTSALAMREATGRAQRLTGTTCDIHFEHEAELARGRDALRDPLTGLVSRALLLDRADQLIRRAARDPACIPALLLVDLDHFHLVEERYGRGVGDALLAAVGRRIAGLLRPGDTAARVGDDEFALLLDGAGGEPGARTVARRILEALAVPFALDSRRMLVAATAGLALGDPDVTDAATLLERAEAGMYTAKRTARGGVARYEAGPGREDRRRVSREAELRRLVDDGELEAHYQPIVDLAHRRIRGLEAFVRWPEGEDAPSPLEFVPLAEELGLIAPLSLHVMTQALEALARWRERGLIDDTVTMSVNLSPRQLSDPQLPALVRSALAAGGVPARVLRLDVAERSLSGDAALPGRWVTEVCESGVALHLDNFGTASSPLAALSRLPVAALKIDRSIVAGLSDAPGPADAVVRSSVALARAIGVTTIAEGVESEAQLRRLTELECDAAQGYLFAPPASAEAMEAILAGWPAALPAAV